MSSGLKEIITNLGRKGGEDERKEGDDDNLAVF